jgi:predicted flavoprotein YhiN
MEEHVNISGITGSSWATMTQTGQNLPGNSPSATTTNASGSSASTGDGAVQQFMNYMKETPAQRLVNAWLQQHGISPQQFAAMSAADKQKIINEMKTDIENELKQKMETASSSKPALNILV